MKRSVIPVCCSLALASMSSAVLSHWWTVEEFATAVSATPELLPAQLQGTLPAIVPTATLAGAPRTTPPNQPLANVASPKGRTAQPPQPTAAQKEFYAAMLDEMKLIRKENTALRDQMAETNRDLMKLEFRVDTHSESFRPLRVEEEEAPLEPPMIDDGPGVLPPRPAVVDLPEME